MKRIIVGVLSLALLVALAGPAQAKRHHHHHKAPPAGSDFVLPPLCPQDLGVFCFPASFEWIFDGVGNLTGHQIQAIAVSDGFIDAFLSCDPHQHLVLAYGGDGVEVCSDLWGSAGSDARTAFATHMLAHDTHLESLWRNGPFDQGYENAGIVFPPATPTGPCIVGPSGNLC